MSKMIKKVLRLKVKDKPLVYTEENAEIFLKKKSRKQQEKHKDTEVQF